MHNNIPITLRLVIITVTLTFSLIARDLSLIRSYHNPNEVTDLAEMDSNIVWTTSNCGLSRWNLATGEVITYNSQNSPLPRDFAQHVAIKDDKIWVTSGKRLFRIVNNEWTAYTWQDIGMPFEYDFDLVAYDNWGRLWVSFSYGVAYYKDGEWTYFDENNSTLNPYIKSMEPGIAGEMWFGHTELWTYNLSEFTSEGSWNPYYGFYYPEQIAVESDGQVWVQRNGRIGRVYPDTILKFNGEHAHWPQYRDKLFQDIWDDKDGLRLYSQHRIYHKQVGSMNVQQKWSFPDSLPYLYLLDDSPRGNVYFRVWDPFVTKGFIKLDSNFSWKWYQTGKDLNNNLVEGIFLGPDNTVYIGKHRHKINYQSRGSNLVRSQRIIRYPHAVNDSVFAWVHNGNIKFSNNENIILNQEVWDFDVADDGTIYFVTTGMESGVYYIDQNNEAKRLEDCPMESFRYICVDNRGHVWISDYNWQGTAVYDGYAWDFYGYQDPRVAQSNIDEFYIDSWGRVWCATNNSSPNFGLSMYDGQKWHIFDKNKGLPTPNIYQFAEDAFGNLWMATDQGLVKYNGSDFAVFNHLNSDLPSPTIESIVIDKTGNFWVGTKNGLYILNEDGEFMSELPDKNAADNFQIEIKSGHPLITWEMHNIPQDFAGFYLEKSRFGNKYTRIKSIPYFDKKHQYSFRDTTTKYGTQHYRLIEYDQSGRSRESLSDSINISSTINVQLSKVLKYENRDSIAIEWKTDSPDDIKFFALYCQESDEKWDFVTKVAATSDSIHKYFDKTDSLSKISYQVKAITHDGIEFSSDARSVKIIKEIPENYALGELYPNPSNNKISLDLDLPEKTSLELTVYNILGQRVKKMETGKISAGYQRLNIDIGDLSTGVYILFVNSPFNKTYKFTVLK